jgi:hypothetical protein
MHEDRHGFVYCCCYGLNLWRQLHCFDNELSQQFGLPLEFLTVKVLVLRKLNIKRMAISGLDMYKESKP